MRLSLRDAALLGCTTSVQAALAAGESASAIQNGWTVLHSACHSGSVECVELLLAAGANIVVNVAETYFGVTPLHLAAGYNTSRHTQCVAALLAAGADPCTTNNKCRTTALRVAMLIGTFEAACLMLRAAPKAALLVSHPGSKLIKYARRKHPCLCLLLPPDLVLDHLPQLRGTHGPLPGLGVALPAALQRSEAAAALLVRHMTADDQQQLRTLALSLCAAQRRGQLPQLPTHLAHRLLTECAAQHGQQQLAAQVSREVQREADLERQQPHQGSVFRFFDPPPR